MNRIDLVVRGQVQGVGFRPFVVRTARSLELTGWVRNEPAGVRIEAEGPVERLVKLEAALWEAPAPISVVEVVRQALELAGDTSFELRASLVHGAPMPVVPPDLATCTDCRAELNDPHDRRFGYPLLSCTACGPRYTIARTLPFDRERTEMDRFPLCAPCLAEYGDPGDRRFHAQATVCADCGPQVRFGDHVGTEAIAAAARCLQSGGIVAFKGLGGFQLLCDATDDQAVRRLRSHKRRPHKPLAVLFSGLDGLNVTEAEAQLLLSAAGPIVLVPSPKLAPSVSDGLPRCGALLPTTALHLLLMEAVHRPLVCTSGNVSGDPLCRDGDEVRRELAFVDGVLDHDRPIARAADDSVARVVGAAPLLMRRARGHAPAPVALGRGGPTILAVGGHLKNTVALAVDDQAVLSPHIGTLGGRRMNARFESEVRGLCRIYNREPELVVCDSHPDYASTRFAERMGLPVSRVQHHHAHVAAVMAEHGLSGPVTGFALDGAGLGTDGTIWGAEILGWDGERFSRTSLLEPFPLPGGDLAARSPARCAIGVFPGLVDERAADHLPAGAVPVLRQGMERGLFPLATSMGRLFDAVAFVCGGPGTTTYEAAAAMKLEALAERGLAEGESEAYPLHDLQAALQADLRDGVPPTRMAARFHLGVVEALVAHAREAAVPDVVLAGGCFQNAVLLDLTRQRIRNEGSRVHVPERLPPGDGALSLGQLWLARRA